MLKIRKCDGNGQGHCALCESRGKSIPMWMCFLYKVDGVDGCYCYDCAREIAVKKIKSYICMYYDTKSNSWHHSERVDKKEAEFLMKELLNSNDTNIANVQVAKIVHEGI